LWLSSAMAREDMSAELFVRGWGVCPGTVFSGEILGLSHTFSLDGHAMEVRLPSAEFEEGSHDPSGPSASYVRFRSGYVKQDYRKSFYSTDRIAVEVGVQEMVRIPESLLEVDAVQKSPEVYSSHPHLEKIAKEYDGIAASGWAHWIKIARWATNQPLIGIPDLTIDGSRTLQMPRLRERQSGFAVWSSVSTVTLQESSHIDLKRWEHIGAVLGSSATPPVWFDYLVEAEQRLYNRDFSGCVLSAAIACETLARACYFHLLGTPIHATAAEFVDRTAAQAIIGRWKKLTGLDQDKKVHKVFDIRNRLVHSGSADVIDKVAAREALSATRRFLDSGDRWWFDQKGRANPRAEAAGWPKATDAAKLELDLTAD